MNTVASLLEYYIEFIIQNIIIDTMFIFIAQIYIIVLTIFVQSINGQNRRQNYVPRGDISNDSDLEEASKANGNGAPRTTPEVSYCPLTV